MQSSDDQPRFLATAHTETNWNFYSLTMRQCDRFDCFVNTLKYFYAHEVHVLAYIQLFKIQCNQVRLGMKKC